MLWDREKGKSRQRPAVFDDKKVEGNKKGKKEGRKEHKRKKRKGGTQKLERNIKKEARQES